MASTSSDVGRSSSSVIISIVVVFVVSVGLILVAKYDSKKIKDMTDEELYHYEINQEVKYYRDLYRDDFINYK